MTINSCAGVDTTADCCYFVGNSLGLAPKTIHQKMTVELEKWAKRFVG